jgi:hypothetical protein
MTITIKIENQHDFQWVLPFLESIKMNTSAKVDIVSNKSFKEKNWDAQLNDFFQFIEIHSVIVPKIELLSRDQLNER